MGVQAHDSEDRRNITMEGKQIDVITVAQSPLHGPWSNNYCWMCVTVAPCSTTLRDHTITCSRSSTALDGFRVSTPSTLRAHRRPRGNKPSLRIRLFLPSELPPQKTTRSISCCSSYPSSRRSRAPSRRLHFPLRVQFQSNRTLLLVLFPLLSVLVLPCSLFRPTTRPFWAKY
jgi:hypothetical protein